MIVLTNLLLLFALFVSANLALAWGELASYDLAGDKSGLAGLDGAFIFMVFRWTGLATVIWIAARRGGFGWLPWNPRYHPMVAVCGHAALGVLSYRAFERVVGAIQESDPGPLRLGWVFGIALPVAVYLVAFRS